jgi:hypothetical protein
VAIPIKEDLTNMFSFKGYKGKTYEADYGWDVADENGRGGKLVLVVIGDSETGERVLLVEPRLDHSLAEQLTITLRESEVSFVHPPEVE